MLLRWGCQTCRHEFSGRAFEGGDPFVGLGEWKHKKANQENE